MSRDQEAAALNAQPAIAGTTHKVESGAMVRLTWAGFGLGTYTYEDDDEEEEERDERQWDEEVEG